MSVETKMTTAYICGTDLKYELQAPDMLGDCKITPNKHYAETADNWACREDCGIAEIEVRFVRWIRKPTV